MMYEDHMGPEGMGMPQEGMMRPDPRGGVVKVIEELLDYLTECKVKYLAKCYELDDKCQELAELKGEEFKPSYDNMEEELEDLSEYKKKIKAMIMGMLS